MTITVPVEKAIRDYALQDWNAAEDRNLPAMNRKLGMQNARTDDDMPWGHPWIALANMNRGEAIHMRNGDVWTVKSISAKQIRLINQKGVTRNLSPGSERHARMIRDMSALLMFGDDIGGDLFKAMARDPIFEGKPIYQARPGPRQIVRPEPVARIAAAQQQPRLGL